MIKDLCAHCLRHTDTYPMECPRTDHWRLYVVNVQEKLDQAIEQLDMRDEDRDKFDVAEWLKHYQKAKDYVCSACGRDYRLPTHMTHFTCLCGQRCRLRHLGGTNPEEAVIDAAIQYFGTERMAQLAYLSEVIGGKYCEHYTADEIRKMIRQEMDKWVMTDDGWRKQ